jgi:hypothetical protein
MAIVLAAQDPGFDLLDLFAEDHGVLRTRNVRASR